MCPLTLTEDETCIVVDRLRDGIRVFYREIVSGAFFANREEELETLVAASWGLGMRLWIAS